MSDLENETISESIFRPPPKGDITLRSSDGVEFQTHSAILNLASSVFEGLLVVGTAKDVVELSETAETISLMLRFIYPNEKTPLMTSFEMLAQCLEAAHKYDLAGMLGTLDDQLATKASSEPLIYEDPVRLYQLALQFNLADTKVTAAPLATASETDFCDPSHLAELIQTHSPASVIRLAAIQGTRATVLADILLNFEKRPILPKPEQRFLFYNLSCAACRKWLKECKESTSRKGMYKTHPPSWVLAWASLAYRTLRVDSLEDSDELFDASILEGFEGTRNVCQDCLEDFWEVRSQRREFNEWAQNIRDVLEKRLEGLEHLYSL